MPPARKPKIRPAAPGNPQVTRWGRLLLNRLPLLGLPLRRLAIARLTAGFPQDEPRVAVLLAEALSRGLDEPSRDKILAFLEQVKHPETIDTLWHKWLAGRNQLLLQLLTKRALPASEDCPARAASLVELNLPAEMAQSGAAQVDQLIRLLPDSDPILANSAQAALGSLQNAAGVDRLCELWSQGRDPALEKIILTSGCTPRRPPVARVLTLLLQRRPELLLGADASLVGPLLAACQDSNPVVRALAQECLPNLQDPGAIDETCRLWLESRSPILESALLKAHYLPTQPLASRLYTALLTARLNLAAACPPDGVEILFKACLDVNPAIAGAARQVLLSLEYPLSQQAVCRRVIQVGDALSQEIALQAGYLPDSQSERALFLFLTGQFSDYDALDFDHRLMQAAYENAPDSLQKRITRLIQQSGKTEYLNILMGLDLATARSSLGLEEIQAFLHTLSEAQAWERLWQALPRFPIAWAVEGLRRLRAAGWEPADGADSLTYQEMLACLYADCPLEPAALEKLLPFAVRRARLKIRGRVNDLSFSPDGAQMAIGTGARRVGFWDFQHGKLNRVVSGFNHSISRVLFHPEGGLFCGQRSTNHTLCSIYGWENEVSFLLGSHQGAVVALEAAGPGRMLSAGRDGRLALWDLAAKRILVERSLTSWPRTLAVSADGKRAAIQTLSTQLVSLPDLKTLPFNVRSAVRAPISLGIARCLAYDQRGAILAGQYNGQVLVYEQKSNRQSYSRELLFTHPSQVISVQPVPGHPYLITGCQSGSLHVLRWPQQLPGADLQIPEGRLTSLRISPDGAFLATGTDEEQIVLWDLRTLDIPPLFDQPINQASIRQLSMLNGFMTEETIPPGARNSLRLLSLFLQKHFGNDIEIGEIPGIRPGEFDIIIE